MKMALDAITLRRTHPPFPPQKTHFQCLNVQSAERWLTCSLARSLAFLNFQFTPFVKHSWMMRNECVSGRFVSNAFDVWNSLCHWSLISTLNAYNIAMESISIFQQLELATTQKKLPSNIYISNILAAIFCQFFQINSYWKCIFFLVAFPFTNKRVQYIRRFSIATVFLYVHLQHSHSWNKN